MIAKCFEVRDRATFMPVMAIKLVATDIRDFMLLKAAGYPMDNPKEVVIILIDLEKCSAANNPYEWINVARTLPYAHKHIEKLFDSLNPGDVVDVEFLEGETTEPKKREVLKHL